MTRLSLVRAGEEGDHLIVATESGEEFELPLTDDLRRTVALTRPRVRANHPHDQERTASSLSPKEIQQRIRSGLDARELAELTGEPYEALERYEPPVLAERAYIAELARATRIGRDSGAPVLADLVTDRLASRGVDPEAVVWDAWREVDEPWLVAVDFTVDGRNVRALWEFDHTVRAVTAQDDESRWLTETELLDVPIPRRHLSAVRPEQDDAPLDQTRPLMPIAPDADDA
ncbi:MAG: septation protein SepH, partial [Demequina sp.]